MFVVVALLDFIVWIVWLVIWVFSVSSNVFVWFVGVDLKGLCEVVMEEELRNIVVMNEELSVDEWWLINEVFDVGDRLVWEIMVFWFDVSVLDVGMMVGEVFDVVEG